MSLLAGFSSIWGLGSGHSSSLVCLAMGQEPIEFQSYGTISSSSRKPGVGGLALVVPGD